MEDIRNADLLEALRAEFGGYKAAIDALNAEVKSLKETNTATEQRAAKAETTLSELAQRMSRGEKLKHDTVTFAPDGRAIVRVSDGLAKFAVDVMKRALGSTNGPDGGYLVPPDYVPELLQIITLYGQFRKEARIVTMTSDEKTYPTLDGGVTLSWIDGDNAVDIPESAPTFGQVVLNVKTLAGRVTIPHGLLQDANPEIGSILVDVFGREFGKEEDRIGFAGKAAAHGGTDLFDGLLYADNVNELVMGAGQVSFNNLTADHLLDLTDKLSTGAKVGARFYMHPTILSVVKKLKDANGQYIWQGPSQGQPASIWGYPYQLIEQLPSISQDGSGKTFIVFGNLIYVMLGDRQQVQFALSEHEKFSKIQTVLRCYERLAIKVAQPTGIARLKTA